MARSRISDLGMYFGFTKGLVGPNAASLVAQLLLYLLTLLLEFLTNLFALLLGLIAAFPRSSSTLEAPSPRAATIARAGIRKRNRLATIVPFLQTRRDCDTTRAAISLSCRLPLSG